MWRDRNGNERKTTVILASRVLALGGKGELRDPQPSERADMSWLDEAAPSRAPAADDEIPF